MGENEQNNYYNNNENGIEIGKRDHIVVCLNVNGNTEKQSYDTEDERIILTQLISTCINKFFVSGHGRIFSFLLFK